MTFKAAKGEIHAGTETCKAVLRDHIHLIEGVFNGMVGDPPAVIFPEDIDSWVCWLTFRDGRPAYHVGLPSQDKQMHSPSMLLGDLYDGEIILAC